MGDPYIPPNRSLADSEEFTEVFRELQTVAIQISNAGPVGWSLSDFAVLIGNLARSGYDDA